MDTKKFFIGRAIGFVVILSLVLVIFLITRTPGIAPQNTPPEEEFVPSPIVSEDIKEPNWEGKVPVIIGERTLEKTARAHIDKRVSEFRTQADEQVPQLRIDFPDSPISNYTLEIEAKYVFGNKTDSIVISEYAYTGGANGHSSYRVFTALRAEENLLSLSDVILEQNQNDFTKLVKERILARKTQDLSVFETEVEGLTFDSFRDWSLDEENLNLYFDKYEIGPGAMGAFVFSIPLKDIQGWTVSKHVLADMSEYCFAYSQKATESAPYEVEETVTLNISGTKVSGEKTGTQKGPDMQNGYTGTLSGTIKGKVIEAVYSYTIEGSKQKEMEVYELNANSLIKQRWPLKEDNGMLVPDKTGTLSLITYIKRDCSN